MKITVLNGSPKGTISVTYQYLSLLKKKFSNIEFNEFHISQKIKLIENKKEEFDKIIDSVRNSDVVLWITPVYHFTVPSQLKRFIEMLFENSCEPVFKNKYSTLITTSIHFYDNMAENYIHSVSEDLGMKYIKGFLAEMRDMNFVDKRENFINHFKLFKRKIEKKAPVAKSFSKLNYNNWNYEPKNIIPVNKDNSYKILAITDIKDKNSNLAEMLKTYQKLLPNKLDIIDLNQINIKSGCIGCCTCGANNQCVIKDDLIAIHKEKIKESDAIIYFSEIKDRFLSSNFKLFFDRSFINGHVPKLEGKHIQYILSGPFSQISNLKEEISARCDFERVNLTDIITDEIADSEDLTNLISESSKNLIYSLDNNIKSLSSFYEVAAHKIFRDFVYFSKPLFSADHKFYKKDKFYDFPQKNIVKYIGSTLLYFLLKNKNFRKKFNTKLKQGMIASSKKIVDSL